MTISRSPSNGADHQAELEERLARYLAGDRHALDYTLDEIYEVDEFKRRKQRSAYVPSVDPASFHTQHAFVKACVIDLTSNGGYDQAEAFKKCKERWAEHETIGVPVTAGQKQLEEIRWNAWFDQRFAGAIKPLASHIGERLGEFIGQTRKADEAYDVLVKDLEDADRKSATAHNQLVRDVGEIRDRLRREVRDDMDSWVKRMDRNFNLEVVALQEKTINQLNADLDVMRRDMTTVMMDNLRTELADEFVKMFVEARDQIRRELRQEMATKIKLLRSAFAKRNRKI
jgi:hypothetical protein